MPAATRIALGLAVALTLTSCGERGWLLMAVNNSNLDVVVRLEADSKIRTWLLEAGAIWDLEHRSGRYESGTISILDPATCDMLFKTFLLPASTVIEVHPGFPEANKPFSDKVRVVVGATDFYPDQIVLEEWDACGGPGESP